MKKPKVYFIKEITPESLIKIYDVMGVNLKGKIAVKISTGEPGGHNFLDPNLIKDLVKKLNGTIVECNTAYAGGRNTNEVHWKTIEEHGFKSIAPCDILDESGEMSIPVVGGMQLKENIIGENLKNYDSMLMLSHFKGHQMGGLGGALKNMSIGIASSRGKILIHTSGKSEVFEDIFKSDHDSFLESMADADKSVMDFMGRENIVYINIANKLSVDCDCNANPEEPKVADIGIMSSTDPVALDQACVDAVYNSQDKGKSHMIERIESRNGIHTIEAAQKLGLGLRDYEIIEID